MIIKTPEQWSLTKDRVLVDGEIQRIAPLLTTIVEHSFSTHPMRNRTAAEYKDRIDYVTKTYFSLRQRGWTEQRAVSHLRQALAAKLDTTSFTPRERCSFVRDPLLFPDAGPRTATALLGGAQGD